MVIVLAMSFWMSRGLRRRDGLDYPLPALISYTRPATASVSFEVGPLSTNKGWPFAGRKAPHEPPRSLVGCPQV
jgi:hypothetical protein